MDKIEPKFFPAEAIKMISDVKSPLDSQIAFCQENRIEWESALLSSGAVGLAAQKNVEMYQKLENSLLKYKELIIIAEMMHNSIHPVEEKSKKARSPESRIRDAKTPKP